MKPCRPDAMASAPARSRAPIFASTPAPVTRAEQIGSLHDEPDDLNYWLSKSPDERLAAMERMRQINYDYDPIADRVSRVLEVVERASG